MEHRNTTSHATGQSQLARGRWLVGARPSSVRTCVGAIIPAASALALGAARVQTVGQAVDCAHFFKLIKLITDS
jgi:hypothetical protein